MRAKDNFTGCKCFTDNGLNVAARNGFPARAVYELVAFYAVLGQDEILPEHLCGPGAGAFATELRPYMRECRRRATKSEGWRAAPLPYYLQGIHDA